MPPELLQKLKEAEAADAEDDMTFEEGIEQLRQEGTDMGGSDYEVTLEDIKEKKASTKKSIMRQSMTARKRKRQRKD